MICNELVELSRGALVLQLQQCVLLDVGSAAENAIEEGSNRRAHVDADSHIYNPYVPWRNHDSSEKDPERDFNRHHRDEVSSFAHNDPLLQSALSSHVLVTLTFVSFSSPSRLVTCVPPPLSAMYSDAAENTVNIIYTLVSQGHAIGLIGLDRTQARIIAASSQPKLAIIQVRVHMRSRMKNQASARNTIAILLDCSPARATSSKSCTIFRARSNGRTSHVL